MAIRKIYFWRTKLFDEMGREVSQQELKKVVIDILLEKGVKQEDHISVDITPYDDDMHVIFDAYDYSENKLFGRFSKQLPKNTLVHHEYNTYKASEILPGVNEKESGIEKYTYGMLYYNTEIWAFISAQGAANEKALKMFIEKFKPGYTLEVIPIPNEKGIENIYNGKEPEISKIEIEVPLPSAEVLEKLFGWKDDQLLENLNNSKLRVVTALKAESRHTITDDPSIVKKIIEAVNEGKAGYNKAKMLAKARTVKAREYNFFEDNFMYPIDVTSYHMRSNERVYYSSQELVDIYRQNMIVAFNDSRGILELFACSGD